MDMVHVNNFGGAMENWGLILYEFDYLLYDPSKPDPEEDKKFDVLETVAHELSHQWFGNLVKDFILHMICHGSCQMSNVCKRLLWIGGTSSG